MGHHQDKPASEPNPDAPPATKEALKKFFELQCYLMDNWQRFAIEARPKGYNSLTCLHGNPSETVQAIISTKGNGAFLDMTPDEFALLVPRIKLYKVPLKPNGKPNYAEGKGDEIIFRTHYDDSTLEDLTTNKIQRGDAVGLKELTYEFYDAGSTEMAARRQKVTLKMQAESLAALAKKPGEGKVGPLDMAIESQKWKYKKDPETGELIPGSATPNSEWYQIKLVYGWAVPDAQEAYLSLEKRKAIANATQSLLLSLTDHSLSFNENGSCTLEVEFQGYTDTTLDALSKDILWIGGGARTAANKKELDKENRKSKRAAAQKVLDAALKKEEKDGSWVYTFVDSDETDAAQAVLQELVDEAEDPDDEEEDTKVKNRAHRYRRLMWILDKSKKIWYVDVDEKEIENFQERLQDQKSLTEIQEMTEEEKADYEKEMAEKYPSKPPKFEPPRIMKRTGSGAFEGGLSAMDEAMEQRLSDWGGADEEDAQEELTEFETAATKGAPSGHKRINYMYFGDLLDAALYAAYQGFGVEELEVRYLLGPMNFRDMRTGKRVTVNIADIPISLALFERWWINMVVAPQRDVFTVKQFIESAVKEMIVASLGPDCFEGGGKGKPQVTFTTMSARKNQDGKEPIPKEMKRVCVPGDVFTPDPTKDVFINPANAKPKDQIEYVFIYCYAFTLNRMGFGDRAKDEARGIYHISLGLDRGPLKKVSFEKSDIPYQATAKAMDAEGMEKLAAAYKAKLTMVGNTVFMPGNYVYIQPTSLGVGEAIAKKLGLGGYYTVTRLDGSLDATGWESDIECIPLYQSPEDDKSGDEPVMNDVYCMPGLDPEDDAQKVLEEE